VVLCLLLLLSVTFAWYRQRRSAGLVAWPDWRRWRAGERAARIKVVAATRLDQRTSLYEVEWDGRRLLLANGERGVSLLCGAEAASAEQAAGAAR
jgi:flagellar biogenesis protein FliO